jgi:uncharacterized membrane protein
MQLNIIILFLATFFTGLMAGLFFTWSFSVTRGLSRLSDTNYIEAFQSLNKAILNPAFAMVFWGSILSLILAAILHYQQPPSGNFWYLLTATIVYLMGSIVVTFAGNIPLNNSLEKIQLNSSSLEEIKIKRTSFEGKWNSLNMIRTISSSLAFILLIIACINYYLK